MGGLAHSEVCLWMHIYPCDVSQYGPGVMVCHVGVAHVVTHLGQTHVLYVFGQKRSWSRLASIWISMVAGVDAIDYFERRFPDLDKMPTSGANANCAEWLLSVTTQV